MELTKNWSSWKYCVLKKYGHCVFLAILTFVIVPSCLSHKYAPEFNDKLAFRISWHGHEFQDKNLLDAESFVINTIEKEKYKCFLPKTSSDGQVDDASNAGLLPEELLADTLNQKSKCSYRLEPYWTYEVCHGLHVRQFHEDKSFSPDKDKPQEYYLGRKIIDNENGENKIEEGEKKKETKQKTKVQTRIIDGRETPYYNVSMGNGTPCDISNNKPRQVDIMYICHPTANSEIVSVKEVTSCEYEVIVLVQELCRNPDYVVKDDPLRDIKCLPLDGAPSRPKSLVEHEAIAMEERAISRTTHLSDGTQTLPDPEIAIGNLPTGDSSLEAPLEPDSKSVHTASSERPAVTPSADEQLTKDFLSGDYCLQGGSGWWQFEFCNGKHVMQYHRDSPQSRTIIYLGFWNKEKHLEWVKNKKKFKSKNHVTHYYSNGDVCDVNGKPRLAQVKLKCMEGHTGQQITIYMVEPSPCEYIVGIESPILCSFIATADSDGLFTS